MTDWDWPNTEVTRVIDGDSCVVLVSKEIGPIDIGFNGSYRTLLTFRQKIRLNRINTPPTKTPTGMAAKSAAIDLLQSGPLHLVTVGPYKYGDEWMGEFITLGGINVADELVRLGLAVYWDGTGPRPGGRLS